MSRYDEGDKCPDGMIEITIERGGEYVRSFIKEGDTVKALIENGQLRGVESVSTRVNGIPSRESTPLQNGDTVAQVPKSGKQG